MKRTLLALVVGVATIAASAQQRRPVPYPVIYDADFTAAIEKGTRTERGTPGPNYWTNTADYVIAASLSPSTGMLKGAETATYHNNSPDALRRVAIHLRQNLHAEGAVRNRPQEVTGGVSLGRVMFNGTELLETQRQGSVGYRIDGSVLWLLLPSSIKSGESATFDLTWSYQVPETGAPRNGTDGEVFFNAYWYPQFAVYDDVQGWKADQYFGEGEFYMGYGDYDVSLTVPQGWLVGATGTLQNAEEVLSDQSVARMYSARSNTDYIIRVVDEADRYQATRTSPSGNLTWRFQAENVRDFAWGASPEYLWDMTMANVGDRDGDGVDDSAEIHAFWRPESTAWVRSAEFGKFSIEFLSETFFPYPYPHMTAMEGIIGGGMEYPMMTLIGSRTNDRRLFGVTLHEIAHMYFPMIVGQDEKDDTWMDEGLTSFNTNEGTVDFWSDPLVWDPSRQGYYRIAGTSDERISRRHADQYPYRTAARGTAAYNKPAVSLHALRGILGDELFYEAYREYAMRWSYKHPEPYDLFNTFEDVTGLDLDWFWTTQFYTTWTLDQAVTGVIDGESGVTVVVEDRGLSPYPVVLTVTYDDGSTEQSVLPVDAWMNGEREQRAEFRAGEVARVEIDPGKYLPDVDRSNNVWTSSR
ncbi:MAG: M1 family metallopeptidase [Rhodothermales bacterium]|nr:M1 family metallopeptidase [Rhodothermales bacterium]